jgi:iron complex outermembrane receptor protein
MTGQSYATDEKSFRNVVFIFATLRLFSCMKPPPHPTVATTTNCLLRGRGVFMRAAVAVAVACFGLVTITSGKDAEAAVRQPTNIAAQGLAPALRILAKERDVQLVYRSELVSQQQTSGAVGHLTFEEALTQLLSGTGLTYRYLDNKAITIVPISSGSSSSAGGAGEADRDAPSTKVIGSESSSQGSLASSTVKLEEIVVTAQKREERLIDVPQSVTVLSPGEMAQQGAVQFRDYAASIPGLSFVSAGAGYTQLTLRGVTTGGDVSSTVGIYVDDVPYGSSTAFANGAQLGLDVGLFDLDRIEVLRGPQGTLYGASALGGVVKYVSKRPDAATFGVDSQLGVSDTASGGVSYNVSAAANLPVITERVAVRTSVYEAHDGGYIDNVTLNRGDVNRSDVYGGRLDVLITPNDALTIRVGGFLQNVSRAGTSLVDSTATGALVYGRLEQSRQLGEPFDQQFRLISGTVTYDFTAATLSSISSYQTANSKVVTDISSLYTPILQLYYGRSYSAVGFPLVDDTNKFTQEVRLVSKPGGSLDWLVGGFYTHETSTDLQYLDLYDLAGQPAPNDVLSYTTPSRYDESAAFGDLTWRLTYNLDVTGGIRVARDDLKFTQNGAGILGTSQPTVQSAENVVTYLGNARYRFSDSSTAYVRYATGYRPGGPNYVGRLAGPDAPPTFQADSLKSYEIGYKAETSDRRFGVDADIYYIDWSNPQIVAIRGGTGFKVNAPGGATVKGSELTLTARPVASLALMGAFAYQNAYVDQANADLGAYAGQRIPNVPRFTAAIRADYAFEGLQTKPTIGATVQHVTDRTTGFGATAFSDSAYTMVDLRAGLTFGSVVTQLYVRNLSNVLGQNLGPPKLSVIQPRTIGITATAHF